MSDQNIVAGLIDELFKTHRHPSGREYSCQEISDALENEIDASYLAKLRRGVIKNPGRNALLQLCNFFQVQPNYFFPEFQPPINEDVSQEDPVKAALRSKKMKPGVRRKLEELIAALEPDEEEDD